MLNLAYVMDPIETLNINKDSTFAMMEEGQKRGHHNYYIQPQDLFFKAGKVWAHGHKVQVQRGDNFFTLGSRETLDLSQMHALSMRKDPPFNMHYILYTYLLDLAAKGTLVINNPTSIRSANEKLFALQFPELIPETLVTSKQSELKAFVKEQEKVVIKPVDGKGGEGIFILSEADPNLNALLDTSTQFGKQMIVAQRYIPEATAGDKRVLFVNGEMLAAIQRVPAADDHRANLNAGAKAVACELTPRDREICAALSPVFKEMGLYFVGIDIIGDYLIEINVTSPTGVQEALKLTGVNVTAALIDFIESQVA